MTMEIGALIRRMREKNKMTQKELCEGICTVRHLSNIENGKVNPSAVIVQALLKKLGL